MKNSLNSLELYYLVKEIKIIEESIFEKVFEGSKEDMQEGDFSFVFHKRGQGNIILRVVLPNYIFLTDNKPKYPQTPPGFCMFLRKQLSGFVVKNIEQRGFDRILEIEFEKREEKKRLIVELIPPGNMLLCNEEGKIINLLTNQKFKDRELKGGITYTPPPFKYNVKEMSLEEIEEKIRIHTKDSIVKCLAMDFGFGGVYAEYLCKESGIEKTKKDLTKEEVKKIVSILKGLFDKKLQGCIYLEEAYPFKINDECEEIGSFSEAIEKMFESKEGIIEEIPIEVIKARKIKEEQSKNIIKLEKEEVEARKKGELIYENYQELKKITEIVRKLIEERRYEDIDNLIKKYPMIKGFDKKNRHLIVKLE